jgi:PTH1 family peptidyl-tRNA hydrolase
MNATDLASWMLIVGLGNPGQTHAGNRHNVGFHCLDLLAAKYDLSFGKKRGEADTAVGRIAGQRVVLVKPQTYVNLSGQAVREVARFYKVEASQILVIYDDLDLPQGATRLRPSGGSGGHNGIKSIIKQINTQNFARLRVGIGRPPGKMQPKNYVLQDFGDAEREVMDEVYGRVVAAVELFIEQGVKEAMNRFNIRPKQDDDA